MIFEIAVTEESHPGSSDIMLWWEQGGIWFRNEVRGADKLGMDQE